MIEKSQLIDTMGRPLTQSLFLEPSYDTRYAVFTFNDNDKIYNGATYISLKRLFMECEDPTEYQFAKKHLLGWNHWKRLNENKMLRVYFDEWREELEIMLRSDAIKAIIDMGAEGSNYQAMKFMADRGWDKRAAGRPSKSEKEREARILDAIGDELGADIVRMSDHR